MPRLRFEIEAEDRGSAEVDKLSRNVDELDRNVDDLTRSMRDQSRAADESERSTGRFNTAVGLSVAAVGGLAAGFIALTRQQAEYHRLVERSSFVSNRSQQDVEALIRTFEQYGIAIDSTEDALRTFYDRLGDARADPNIESAQIFRAIGLEIDRADVRLEDFLARIQTLDRQSQIFVIETIIGGEGAAILQAAADANFQGNLEANLTLTLDPEDRQAILEADQAIERATQQLGLSIDRLIASNSGLIEGLIEGTGQFLTGLSEISESIPRAFQNIESALGDLSRGQFFAPVRRDESPPREGFAQGGRGDVPTPSPELAEGGQRLVLEEGEPPATPEEVADAVVSSPSFERLAGMIQARNERDVIDGGLAAVGPGLTLEARQAFVPGLDTVEPGIGAEAQVYLASIADELRGIHYEIAEFLPEIANNTLSAVTSAAQFAIQPNIVSLVQAGVATARGIGELLELGQPRPVGGTTVEDFAFLGPGGAGGGATIPSLEGYDLSLAGILELIGDEGLIAEHERLQDIATTAWAEIQASTDDEAEQVRLFNEFMTTEFAETWAEFASRVQDAWENSREGLGLTQNELIAFDNYITGTLIPDIVSFGEEAVAQWRLWFDENASIEDQLRLINGFLASELPSSFDALRQIGTLSLQEILRLLGDEGLQGEYEALRRLAIETWQRIRESTVDTTERTNQLEELLSGPLLASWGALGDLAVAEWERIKAQTDDEAERLRLFDEFMNSEQVSSWGALGDRAVDEWNRIKEATIDEEEAIRLFNEFMNTEFLASWQAFGDRVVETWNRNREHLGLTQEQIAVLDDYINNTLGPDIDAFAERAVRAWNNWFDEGASLEEQLAQVETFLGAILPGGLQTFEQAAVNSFTEALTAAGLLDQILTALFESAERGAGAGKVAVDTFTESLFGSVTAAIVLRETLEAIPTEITTVHRIITQEEGGGGGGTPSGGGGSPHRAETHRVREVRRVQVEGGYEEQFRFKVYFDDGSDEYTAWRTERFVPDESDEPETPPTHTDPFGNPTSPQPRPPAPSGFQDGGRFLVDRDSFFRVGEGGTREIVQITPENANNVGGGNVEVQVNIAAVDGQSVEELLRGPGRDAIVQVIRDATSNGEAVVSERGLVDDRTF